MKKNCSVQLFKLFVVICLLFTSCKNLEPRPPISRSTSSNTQLSIELNRELYDAEERKIESIIKLDSLTFERSSNGFYYSFVKKDTLDGLQPRFGDRVTFEYDVISLSGDTIYNKQELSPVTKSLEQEYGIFKGMREALKLMQDGEEMIVYFPSYSAYGYYGDTDRIGINVPFKSNIRLLETQRYARE
jgi:gliding motility-associated peptidyl-prolyl isomerase